jgi:uncharacterized membrane-anchored protein
MPKFSLFSWPALVVVVLLQLGFMAYLILDQERIVWQGTEYRFLSRPIDPHDPFRGKYIVLDFAAESFQVGPRQSWLQKYARNELAYASLSTNDQGFAELTDLSPTPPEGDYLPVTVTRYHTDGSVWVDLPFDRYYLEESKAQPAEALLREAEEADSLRCYAKVKVLQGRSTLTRVMVDEIPIEDYLRKRGF